MDFITILGLVAASCTTISFIPQAVKIIQVRETRDISLLTYLLLEIGILLWLIYGLYLGNLPLIVANTITLVFTTIILGLKIKFG